MPQINNFLSNLSNVNNEIDFIDLVNKIGKIHQENQEEIKISSTNARKFHGIYYNSFEVASTIVKEALKLINIESATRIEFEDLKDLENSYSDYKNLKGKE